MEPDHARQLLSTERDRIEQALAALNRDGPQEGDDRVDPGDRGSEDLYQDEFNAGQLEDLQHQLVALERAEARLEAGTYGLSIQSGDPIPDGRLQARPTAELTIEEQERSRRR